MEPDRFLHALLRNEVGVTDIEYSLVGALVAMAVSVTTLGLNLNVLYKMVAGKVLDATAGV